VHETKLKIRIVWRAMSRGYHYVNKQNRPGAPIERVWRNNCDACASNSAEQDYHTYPGGCMEPLEENERLCALCHRYANGLLELPSRCALLPSCSERCASIMWTQDYWRGVLARAPYVREQARLHARMYPHLPHSDLPRRSTQPGVYAPASPSSTSSLQTTSSRLPPTRRHYSEFFSDEATPRLLLDEEGNLPAELMRPINQN
jgi:hypothetical protein